MGKYSKYIFFLRKQLVIGATLAFYFLSIYYFFYNPKIVWGFVFTIFLFLIIHYFVIEVGKRSMIVVFSVVTFLTLIELIFLGFGNLFYVLGLVVFNLALFFLFFDIHEEIYNRVEISSYRVFTLGLRLYSLLISFVFASAFLGTYRTFDITCDDIYNTMKKFSNYTVSYVSFNISDLKNTKVKDVLSEDKPLAISSGTMMTGEMEEFKGINNIKLEDVFSIKFWKNVIFNQIVENKKVLDKGVCETIVENIKEKYNNPHFQITVLFFIFLLFYPFIRIILYVLSIINFICFKLANWMRLYRFKVVVEDVEIIE